MTDTPPPTPAFAPAAFYPPQPLAYLHETPSQTAGPYVHIGLIPHQAGFDIYERPFSNVLVSPETQGERIVIEGRVFDGSGSVCRDILLEIWQANAAGKYSHPADRQDKPLDPAFRGWGRTGTDFATGVYRFETIKPGRVSGRPSRKQGGEPAPTGPTGRSSAPDAAGRPGGGEMAPHVTFWIVARGINIGLNTRMYFDDEAEANAEDPVLRIVEQPERRETLIARRSEQDGGAVYTFDIHLQGPNETVFFDI